MNADDWIAEAVENTRLSERRATALYHRQDDVDRESLAEDMGTSASNVDNAESEARREIVRSVNLLELASAIGIDIDPVPSIGTCAVCDEPTSTLVPHPGDLDDGLDVEDCRMICPGCSGYDFDE